MVKNRRIWAFVVFWLLLFLIVGCSGNGEKETPEKKALASLEKSEYTDIYDVLEDYPGLESFFTSGDMKISEFEQRLFGDFLGNTKSADVLVALVDLFPSLIDTGTHISAQLFSTDVQKEMKGKGPIPDLVSAVGCLTNNIVDVETKKITPLYDYLDSLDKLENNSKDSPETIELVASFKNYTST